MHDIVGRDAELEAIDAWLDAPRPSPLLIEGDAGIGKTTLWRAAVGQAADRGYRILSCAATPAETQLSYTALRDLLETSFDDVVDGLPEPQRHALDVVLLREEPRGSPPDRATIGVALLTTLRALGASRPTLLAVDDVQWLDVESQAPLRYALRRIEPEAVRALLARRTSPEEHATPRLLEPDHAQVVGMSPLSIGALGHVLHTQLEIAYPRPTLRRIHEISGGNPFFALELARTLGAAPPMGPEAALPVPSALHELVDGRLTALPPETFGALALASAVSRASLELLATALGADPLPTLEPARAAEVVRVEDGAVAFTHPLYAAAVYDLTSSSRRAEIHNRLAQVVVDAEERARHLAIATTDPDEAVAAEVELGARAAFARGSPAVAAELASRAQQLTPPEDLGSASRRSLLEADSSFAAGDTERASTILQELIAAMEPGHARAELLSRQARLRHFGQDIAASIALLHEARAEAEDDSALRGEIEEGLAWGLLLVRSDLPAAAEHARTAARLAEQRGDDAALAEALAIQAVTDLVLGREWEVAMARALSLEESTLGLRTLRHPTFAYGYCLGCADRLDAARERFLELHARAQLKGDEGSVPSILNHLTLIECLSDHWAEADAYAEDGYERALESGQRPSQASILAKKALLAARRGATDAARELAAEALATSGGPAFDPSRPAEAMARGGETAIWALGFLELSLGRPEEAHGLLGPMSSALLAAGVAEPGEIRSLPDEIEALVETDRLDEADALATTLSEWATRLDRASVQAVAGRSRGLVLARRGNSEAALEELEDAAAVHEGVPMPFERGRTLLALGVVQRRLRKRKASRETLHSALAIFDELGAALWAARARAELGRIGGRAPSAGGLTPTEQQVAALVADGKSNKEVATALVVSVHTVEAALTSIYRKLDVRSRTELARILPPTESKD